MDNPSKEVDRWRATIGDLNKQCEVKQTRVEKLQERKKPLTLAAHTGDEKAGEKLGALNAKLLTERQEAEDFAEAVAQAQVKLAKAMTALAVEQEAERLKLLSRLATERVKVARLVDQTARALAQALASYNGIGDKIYRLVAPRDIPFGQKVRSTGRADVALATHLAAVSGCVSRNPNDPRAGQLLEVIEADQLNRLLINPEKAGEIASMNSGGEPESQPEPRAA